MSENEKIDYKEKKEEIIRKLIVNKSADELLNNLVIVAAVERLRFESLIHLLEKKNILDKGEYDENRNKIIDSMDSDKMSYLLLKDVFSGNED